MIQKLELSKINRNEIKNQQKNALKSNWLYRPHLISIKLAYESSSASYHISQYMQ